MIEKRKYPWFGLQSWEDILFVHWKLEPTLVRPFIPKPLQIVTYDSAAWITVVCFVAKMTSLRFLPWFSLRSYIQMNVRTYVKHPNSWETGVYFLKLYAADSFLARMLKYSFNLPVIKENVHLNKERYTYKMEQCKRDEQLFKTSFHKKICQDEQFKSGKKLSEQYCIWNKKGQSIIKLPILHSKWSLQNVEVSVHTNKLHPAIENEQPYFAQYAPMKETKLFPFERHSFHL